MRDGDAHVNENEIAGLYTGCEGDGDFSLRTDLVFTQGLLAGQAFEHTHRNTEITARRAAVLVQRTASVLG